jgi:hypothetical protein
MSLVQQPLILKFSGSGNQTMENADDTPLEATDNVVLAVITTPQSGPPVPVKADGSPLNLDVTVLTPYSLTMPPYGR